MGREPESKSRKKAWYETRWMFLAIILGVIMLWAVTPIIVSYFAEFESSRGIIGDQFGSINALFSGLAFAILIYTLILQRKELELQREELQETQEIMKEQKEEFSRQAALIERENIEQTYFALTRLLNEMIETIRVSENPSLVPRSIEMTIRGRDALGKMFKPPYSLNEYICEKNKITNNDYDRLREILSTWSVTINEDFYKCNHYFGCLENILIFILDQDSGLKEDLCNRLSNQISLPESEMLHYAEYLNVNSDMISEFVKDWLPKDISRLKKLQDFPDSKGIEFPL